MQGVRVFGLILEEFAQGFALFRFVTFVWEALLGVLEFPGGSRARIHRNRNTSYNWIIWSMGKLKENPGYLKKANTRIKTAIKK